MPCKVKEPPRAFFTPRKIKACKLEKPRCGLNKEWISELDAVEERIKNFIDLDMGRLNMICDDRGELERLCNALEMKVPLEEAGLEREFSLFKFPEIRPSPKTIMKKRSRKSQKGEKPTLEGVEDDLTSASSSDLEDDEYRKTLFETAMVRVSEKKEHVSPYKVEWSDEDKDYYSEVSSSSPSCTSTNRSLETTGPLSEDLIVNPASNLTTELLEPLEDARSPYQRFFTRAPKDIREHIERMRKKKFQSFSEKCVDEFVKFLDKKNIRSSKITTETLNNLFNIEVETPAERAFSLDPAELPSVPKEISDIYKEPHSSTRAALHQQIMWDILYEEGKPRKLGFGTSLPKERRPWKKNTREAWFLPPDVDWDLITGHDFWKDLLHSEILEGFGKWLLDNPQHPRPEYLKGVGFFEYLNKKIEKESAPVPLPFKNDKQVEKFLGKMNCPLSFIDDEEKFKELPRYKELKEAAFHRVITKEGLEEYKP